MTERPKSLFASTAARSDLLAKMRYYLRDKDGPLRIERVASIATRVERSDLSPEDKRIAGGVFARCGFHLRNGPHWFRTEPRADATEEKHPAWRKWSAAA
jgi:hypothetical protein